MPFEVVVLKKRWLSKIDDPDIPFVDISVFLFQSFTITKKKKKFVNKIFLSRQQYGAKFLKEKKIEAYS